MAQNNNATCSICGKEYHKCLSCRDLMAARPWQIHTCSSTHYQVFQIMRGYNTGVYTKDEAKSKFKNVDLSDLNEFRDNIKSVIKDILKEEVSVEQIINAKSIDVIDKPSSSRKRRFKVDEEIK